MMMIHLLEIITLITMMVVILMTIAIMSPYCDMKLTTMMHQMMRMTQYMGLTMATIQKILFLKRRHLHPLMQVTMTTTHMPVNSSIDPESDTPMTD